MTTVKNSVRLIGNLGSNPEVRETGKSKLAKFSLATNESYKNDKGEWVTETQWHNIVAWGAQAERVAKYLKKGSEVLVEGKLTNRNYEDKDGVKRYFTEIQLREVLPLGKKEELKN
jgi:single-strand DNA-binding protein